MAGGIHINFSEIPDSEALPSGVYPAVISDVTENESESSDYNYLKWEMTIGGEKFAGRKLSMITSLSPKALWKLRDTLVDLGVSRDELKKPDFQFSPDRVLNTAVEISVSQDTYDGRIVNRTDSIRLPGGTRPIVSPAKAAAPRRI